MKQVAILGLMTAVAMSQPIQVTRSIPTGIVSAGIKKFNGLAAANGRLLEGNSIKDVKKDKKAKSLKEFKNFKKFKGFQKYNSFKKDKKDKKDKKNKKASDKPATTQDTTKSVEKPAVAAVPVDEAPAQVPEQSGLFSSSKSTKKKSILKKVWNIGKTVVKAIKGKPKTPGTPLTSAKPATPGKPQPEPQPQPQPQPVAEEQVNTEAEAQPEQSGVIEGLKRVVNVFKGKSNKPQQAGEPPKEPKKRGFFKTIIKSGKQFVKGLTGKKSTAPATPATPATPGKPQPEPQPEPQPVAEEQTNTEAEAQPEQSGFFADLVKKGFKIGKTLYDSYKKNKKPTGDNQQLQ